MPIFGKILEGATESLRERARSIETPDLIERLAPRRRAGRVESQTFRFRVDGTRLGDVWWQTVRAYRGPKSRSTLVCRLHITCVCTCPAWKYFGPDYLALAGGYLYGFPRSNRVEPSRDDPVCKHVLAIADMSRKTELRIAS